MNKKFKILVILSLSYLCIFLSVNMLTGNSSKSRDKAELTKLNEPLKDPGYYRILDLSKWSEEKSPMASTELENSYIMKECRDQDNVKKITAIIENNDTIPIPQETFQQSWNNTNHSVRFWFYVLMDYDLAIKYYYPSNILVENDLTFYVQVSKGSKHIFLKGKMSEEEFKLIESIYNKTEK